jgi:uncharacterized protein YfkK (UPF0435 family)
MKSYDEVELHEKTVFKICLKLISDKDSEFMIAPMSRKRFIMNETLNLYILIDYGRVEITNHIFHYDVRLSSRNYERITYLYDMEAEKRRSNTEMTIKSNIKNTLEKVYDAISKETQKNK